MILSDRHRLCTVFLVASVLSACILSQCIHGKGAEGDSLWQKAVAIAEVNKGWVPSYAVLRIEIVNKHGEVEQKEEMLLDFASQDTGETLANPYVDPSSLNIVGKSPFEPEFQNEVTARIARETKDVEGKQCVRYQYVWHGEAGVVTGTAWLEQETGMPVKTETSGKESIRSGFSSRQRVTVIFHNESCDAWFPQRMIMEMEAGLLSLGRNFRITLEYQDYGRTE